jgi:hypothetical protein
LVRNLPFVYPVPATISENAKLGSLSYVSEGVFIFKDAMMMLRFARNKVYTKLSQRKSLQPGSVRRFLVGSRESSGDLHLDKLRQRKGADV